MRPDMQMTFSTPEEFPISYAAKNSYWSRDSKIETLVHSASFMYNGKEMKGTLSLLEPLGLIRIGCFASSEQEMAHAHRLLRKREYRIFVTRRMLFNNTQ